MTSCRVSSLIYTYNVASPVKLCCSEECFDAGHITAEQKDFSVVGLHILPSHACYSSEATHMKLLRTLSIVTAAALQQCCCPVPSRSCLDITIKYKLINTQYLTLINAHLRFSPVSLSTDHLLDAGAPRHTNTRDGTTMN